MNRIDTSTWARFRIGELFQPQTGDVDLQQFDIDGKGELFVNSGAGNLGIKGRTSREAKVFPANTITVDFLGNAYYRSEPYKMATHNQVFSLSGEIIKNEAVGTFLAIVISCAVSFSYKNMGTWPKIAAQSILLPVVDGKPDFAYMENYIAVKRTLVSAKIEALLSSM